jgi:hypothetical protein
MRPAEAHSMAIQLGSELVENPCDTLCKLHILQPWHNRLTAVPPQALA